MSFSNWKYYKDFKGNIIGIVNLDGLQSRLLIDVEVTKWLEEGNTPLPAEDIV